MRVVLDTNTLVSAAISPSGSPRRLLNAARALIFQVVTSPVLIAELLDVVSREKLVKRFAMAGADPVDFVKDVRRLAYVVTPPAYPG